MPEMIPVGNTNYVPPPNSGLDTLSSILGIQQRKQALVSGQLDIERQQAGLVGQQQQAKETQAGAQLLADPVGNGITDKDGNVMSNAHVKILQAMPTTGSEKYDQLVKAATGNVQYKNAWLKLRSDVRQDVSARLQGTAVDPTSGMPEIHDTLDAIKSDYSGSPAAEDVNKIVGISKGAIDDAASSHGLPGAKSVISHFSAGGLANTQLSGPGGLGTPQATQIDTGGQIQPGTTAPALQGGGFTPGGAPINKVTPPANMVGPNGQILQVPAGGAGLPRIGGGTPSGSAAPLNRPRTAADDAPPPNAPKAVQDAFQQATAGANTHVDAIRTADETYGNNRAISAAIRHLASDSTTGPGTVYWNRAMGALGTNAGNNVQELGAFLDRQAATVRGQMGLPGTNAGAEDAKMIAGNTSYNTKVIQDKNNYTEALTEGLHQYRNGLDRVAGFGGQASPQAVNQFKAAWTQNFDPNVYRGELAFKRSKAEGEEFIKSLAPEEAKSLAAKRKALNALASGQVPQ